MQTEESKSLNMIITGILQPYVIQYNKTIMNRSHYSDWQSTKHISL